MVIRLGRRRGIKEGNKDGDPPTGIIEKGGRE